ncbi:helix-turn-helix domain-containing protein [Galbibacter sp. EGI 63066]|uniref:GlxA family transcriptional regulator n=1 Tax=Galbibacter sp. EGI 63066 TaxID=2993559 RepID=UPI0022496183|nr:helix-turn-helix domain-containing protein [Galbibacter sp. EGI 63066]MCX2681564.1 helix-turn-helix domain-containing protein [Galbibacter sp. EGI 63066]
MKQVSIIIPKGHFSLVNVEGTHHMFSWVNSYYEQMGKSPVFKLNLVGVDKPVTQTSGLFTIHPQQTLEEVSETDIIVVPAIHGDLDKVYKDNASLLPWLVKHYKKGAEIVTFCIGSFVLGQAGLLDGRPCSTHWQYANEFRNQFPKAILRDDRIITDADGIYTSGGAYSFTNLLVYLIEKYAGREAAVLVSKGFMVDIDRESQSPFMMFKGQKTHADAEVLEAQQYIEANFQEKITVDELCESSNVSRRTFERRFKKATANTILEYIRRVKIEAAKKDLESGRKTVNEVMYDVGYNDTKAFRETFKKVTGMTPVGYRNKFVVARA